MEGMRDRDMALVGGTRQWMMVVAGMAGAAGAAEVTLRTCFNTKKGPGSLAHQTASSMAISTPHSFCSLHPLCYEHGYICKCNHAIVLGFFCSVGRHHGRLAFQHLCRQSPSFPSSALACSWRLLLLVRPVCLTDYRAPVAQVTRVTNLAGVELRIIASAL